ncbi:oligosaccharide flippase family protein [Pseudalgibacter alginicilyticus]|nr:oligosaccharide flippase family protein [Pseudalgibacter alginicilyticus]
MKNKSLIIPFVEVLSKAISFLNILLFIRILNIEDYADYSYLVAIVLWSSVVMDGGINTLIYNKSLKNDTNEINTLFTSRLFLSLVVITIVGFFFLYKSPLLAVSALIFSFVTYFSSTSALVKMLSRGLGFIKVDVLSILSEPLIRFFFLLIIYFTRFIFQYKLWHVLLIYLIAGVIAFYINKLYLNSVFSLNFYFNGIKSIYSNIVKSLKQSKYYLFYYLMLVGIGRVDVIFLESYSNKVQLALFSSALNLYQVAQLFFISIITSQFIKLYNSKKLIIKFLVPLLIVSILFTNIASPIIYKYLFPLDYINGQFVLNILIIAILPSIINYYYIVENNYVDRVKLNFGILLIAFVVKILIYLTLKPIDLLTYSYVFVFAECAVFLMFIIKKKYENITDK